MVVPPENAHPVGMKSQVTPETDLEQRLLTDPRPQAGPGWGRPRPGRPEGRVTDHVAGMLATIASYDPLRGDLRFLALVHDSFKAKFRPNEPVLTRDDGLRVLQTRRWRGSRRELIERVEQVVREALAAHPIFAHARPAEARFFRPATTG
jgi:hypothetical protein